MLAEMTPAEMDERIAMEVLEEEKRERFAGILQLGFTGICRALGAKHTPEDFEPDRKRVMAATPDTASSDTIEREPVASPNQAAMIAACALGPPNRRRG